MNTQLAAGRPDSPGAMTAKLVTVLGHSTGATTNIESVIAAAGISERQIVMQFGSNRELVLALVSQLSDAMLEGLHPAATAAELRQRLLEFGERVSEFYGSYLRGLYRIAITESIRHTGLGRDFYDAGPGRLTQRLAHFLQSAQVEGVLGTGNPHLLASHLLASLRANLDIADTFLPAASPVANASVPNVVDLFLGGINEGRQPC